jgi:hypothetical protein
MPPLGFELTISADERPQTNVLDRAATGTGKVSLTLHQREWQHIYVTHMPAHYTEYQLLAVNEVEPRV